MKLLLDMNLSPRLKLVLEAAGFEAVHWSNLGPIQATDIEIMAYAKANAFVVVTHDLDFSAILAATNGDKPSVVQIRTIDLLPEFIGPPLVAALRQCAGEIEQGALLTIDVERHRLRLLPLDAYPS